MTNTSITDHFATEIRQTTAQDEERRLIRQQARTLANDAPRLIETGEYLPYYKLIELAPAPRLTNETRQQLFDYSLKLAGEVGYSSVGTVEFLVDKHRRFYFMELNARVQVEHPVTEMVTGFDIVREQLRIAAGQPLSITQ